MKKLVASVGLVALGASALQTATAQGLQGPDGSKPWSVSATLRGFYDDNVSCIPDDYVIPSGEDEDSFGFEISPSAQFRWDRDQTSISLGYTYSYKYYDSRPIGMDDHDDQNHNFNAALSHAFSERYQLQVVDSFVIGQEPDMLRAGSTFNTFQRISGDNIRNYGSIAFNAELSEQFGMEVAYANGYYNYDDSNVDYGYSALLDRLEHAIRLDGKWKATERTTGVLGYTFGMTDYTADQLIDPYSDYTSDVRNSRSHYVYVGADHAFAPDLQGSLRVGGRYIDFYNDPTGEDNITPYVRGSLRYFYGTENYLEGGFSYDRSATDVARGSFANGAPTLDADTGTIFANLYHKLTPKLGGTVTAQFQNSEFNKGYYDGDSEQMYLIGLELEYRFNQYLAAHAGYNYDHLESDIGRTFDRNRVYVGVTASY